MPNEAMWEAKVGGSSSENGGPLLLRPLSGSLFPTLRRPVGGGGGGRERYPVDAPASFRLFNPHSHSEIFYYFLHFKYE